MWLVIVLIFMMFPSMQLIQVYADWQTRRGLEVRWEKIRLQLAVASVKRSLLCFSRRFMSSPTNLAAVEATPPAPGSGRIVDFSSCARRLLSRPIPHGPYLIRC